MDRQTDIAAHVLHLDPDRLHAHIWHTGSLTSEWTLTVLGSYKSCDHVASDIRQLIAASPEYALPQLRHMTRRYLTVLQEHLKSYTKKEP
jgi:hypothetical protein